VEKTLIQIVKSKVSIILPNYNSHEFIKRTIMSILNQTYKNWELLIIDDNSNDITRNILRKYSKNKKIKIFFLKKNMGAGYCRNFALKKIKSKFIAFIDSDDTWNKKKLEEQIKFMENRNYSFSYTFYKTLKKNNKKNIITPLKYNFSSFIKNTSIATSSMIVKKFNSSKIKFTNSTSCDDYYFKCALLKKYKYAYCYPKFYTNYQIRINSVQKSRLRNIYWVWTINKYYNKLSFLNNLLSIFFISLNSLKKYGFK